MNEVVLSISQNREMVHPTAYRAKFGEKPMMKKIRTSAIVALLISALALVAPAVAQPSSPNSIDGDWIVSFTLQGNQTVSGRMTLQVVGRELTGTVETEHTGPGKLEQGTWTARQMSATCVFETHENINITGELKGRKLSGGFRTEGMKGTWQAVRAGIPGAGDQPPQ
jgi:hypothetical protein